VSLHLRLSLLFLGLIVLGFWSVLGRSLEVARQQVADDIAAARLLSTQLVTLLLHAHDETSDLAQIPDLHVHLQDLQKELGFGVSLSSSLRDYPVLPQPAVPELRAPLWFINMLVIDPAALLLQFESRQGDKVEIRIEPAADINSTWQLVRHELTLNSLVLLLFYGCSVLLIGYWLAPLRQIVPALRDIIGGDYERRIAPVGFPEVNAIAAEVNNLVDVLGASKADNERLATQAITVQERERRYFAQELHDSLGQAVSAIKAMAVSIAMRTRASDPVVAESAEKIERISDVAYASVRDMMALLRPAVLDELGLKQALQHMVDEWNGHHEDVFCKLDIKGSFDELLEDQKINIYRIVQEALTNAVKHADAATISITLSGDDIVTLVISDDGKGFDQHKAPSGMGLRSIRDRTTMLQGRFAISSRHGLGTTLQVDFPRVTRYRRRASDRIPA
jgi:two-component system, NarL family, sensor histidine kinase UhpB